MEIIKQFIYCPFFISYFEEPEIFVEKQNFILIFVILLFQIQQLLASNPAYEDWNPAL